MNKHLSCMQMRKYLPLAFSNTDKYEMMNFKGYEYYWDSSEVSGTQKLVYTNTKKDFEVKYYDDVVVTDSIKIAKGYYIPPEYSFLANKLKLHGIHPAILLSEIKKELVPAINLRKSNFPKPLMKAGSQLLSIVLGTQKK